ncbi:isoaspartyl peptidase/L-asparaginase (plasmid) [Rhizobium leguminosarum bv. trifolii]
MWSIILHGGAKTIAMKDMAANRSGCRKALEAGAAILRNGGTSIDAAEAAVRVLEDDPTFNAGYGSVQNEDGEVECCAAMMEGERFNVGAIAAAKGVRNPVAAAKAMLFDKPVLIAGDGARAFAAQGSAIRMRSSLCMKPSNRMPKNVTTPLAALHSMNKHFWRLPCQPVDCRELRPVASAIPLSQVAVSTATTISAGQYFRVMVRISPG